MMLVNGGDQLPWLLRESHGFCEDLTVLYNLCTGSQGRIRKKLLVFQNERHIVFSNLLKVADQSLLSKLIHQFDFETALLARMNCSVKLDQISLTAVAMPIS